MEAFSKQFVKLNRCLYFKSIKQISFYDFKLLSSPFQVLSPEKYAKRLLDLSCLSRLSVLPHGITQLPLDGSVCDYTHTNIYKRIYIYIYVYIYIYIVRVYYIFYTFIVQLKFMSTKF